jgi:hypothetical protein
VPVVLLYSGHYGLTSLSDIHLTTLAGYAVNPWSSRSHVVLHQTKETGDLARWQVNTLNVVFGQYSAEPAICHLVVWKKSDKGGLLVQLRGSNRLVEGPWYLLYIITILCESGFEELHLEDFLVAKSPGSVH